MVRELPPEFSFAGFSFPKWVWSLPKGSKAERLTEAKNPVCGPYFHSPKPGGGKGCGFYLESDGGIALRWTWADKVSGAGIEHTGWYSDEHGDSEKIRGLVLRLPRSRGFPAAMGRKNHLGRRIPFAELPEDCRKLVMQDYLELWDLKGGGK